MDTGFMNFGAEQFSFDLWLTGEDEVTSHADATISSPFQQDSTDDFDDDHTSDLLKGMSDMLASEIFKFEDLSIDPIVDANYLPPLIFDVHGTIETKPFIKNDTEYFDVNKYLNNEESLNLESVTKRKIAAPVKKIDINARKYIIDEKLPQIKVEDTTVDVETVSDERITVLEASDPLGLLEQFEASEQPHLKHNNKSNNELELWNNTTIDYIPDKLPPHQIFADDIAEDNDQNSNHFKESIIDVMTNNDSEDVYSNPNKIRDVNIKCENKTTIKEENGHNKTNQNSNSSSALKLNSKTPQLSGPSNKSQIRDSLPQELINRINESGKRKPIPVIPAIPNKKRGAPRLSTDNLQQQSKIIKLMNQKNIVNDHDYCATVQPVQDTLKSNLYPKEPKRDSGFDSGEEEERASIRNQPVVKTDDGKLMVSLLKVNTITSNSNRQKKKLNLEEYKKRRPLSATTSQCNSPISSTCSSPSPEQEDENLRRLKHQEKLNQMAAELLKTSPKSINKNEENTVNIVKEKEQPPQQSITIPNNNVDDNSNSTDNNTVPVTVTIPPDMEKKEFVSVGINTNLSEEDFTSVVDGLEEIEPLLQKVSNKINSNSFITSLIENKVKRKKDHTTDKCDKLTPNNNVEDIRENLVVVWLKKDRPAVETIDREVQTGISITEDEVPSRYRRRNSSEAESVSSSSSSSGSIRSSRKIRRSSPESRRHRSSSSSSRSSKSRSRSRSSYTKRNRITAQHIKEVEERRVIYVGRLEKGTDKYELIRRFESFGPVTDASVHERDGNNSFGFVTYLNREDAYEAVEHGNDAYGYEKYDLSFGGRRLFCKTQYSDLDNMPEEDYNYHHSSSVLSSSGMNKEESFDSMLRAFQAFRKRKP